MPVGSASDDFGFPRVLANAKAARAYLHRMDTITLCGMSAYQALRIPPPVLWLALLACAESPSRPALGGIGHTLLLLEALGVRRPIEVLRPTPGQRTHTSRLKGRSLRLPQGDQSTTPLVAKAVVRACGSDPLRGLQAPSPHAALLTLAPQLGSARLALAASELMGSFAVYRPSPTIQACLDAFAGRVSPPSPSALDGSLLPAERAAGMSFRFLESGRCPDELQRLLTHEVRDGGWRQAVDPNGMPTDLWRRDPLLTPQALMQYAKEARSFHGGRILADGSRMALPNTASPFEAQAGILLGEDRRRGGEGLGRPTCNQRIALGARARAIARQSVCYCDLLFEGSRRTKPLDVECHSRRWHDAGVEKRILDANRQTALAHMGVNTRLLTFETVADDDAFATFVETCRMDLGLVAPPPASDVLQRRREVLRAKVLVDWETFGT